MLRRALALLACSPALLPLSLILQHSVDMPYMDQWSPTAAGLYIKAYQGHLTLHDLLALHNEHRVVVPRLISLGLNALTHWNTTVESVAGWVFLAAISAALLLLLRRTCTRGPAPAPDGLVYALWFLCNLILFSPAQWENLLPGIGMTQILPLAFVATTLVVLTSRARPWAKAVTAMLLSTAANYTNACGLFFWPLIGAALAGSVPRGERALRGRILGVYGVWAGINVMLYFVGYSRPSHNGAQLSTMNPVKLVVYTLAFLGSLFAPASAAAPVLAASVTGFALAVLFLACAGYVLYVARRLGDLDPLLRAVPWLVLGGMAVVSATVSSISRANPGPAAGIASRYVTFSLPLPISLVVLVPLVCEDLRRRRGRGYARWVRGAAIRIPAALGTALVLMALAVVPGAQRAIAATEMRRREGKAALLLIHTLPDSPALLSRVYPEFDTIRTRAPQLDAMGYLHPRLIQTADAAQIEASGAGVEARGALERVGQVDDEHIGVSGWAIAPGRSRPSDAVFLTYDDERRHPIIFMLAEMGSERPDVAAREGDDGYLESGWVAVFPRRRLSESPRRATIVAWALDTDTGTARRLDGAQTIER